MGFKLCLGSQVEFMTLCHAMRKTGVVSGWNNNPMTLLNGQGTYSEEYVVWPAPGNVQLSMDQCIRIIEVGTQNGLIERMKDEG